MVSGNARQRRHKLTLARPPGGAAKDCFATLTERVIRSILLRALRNSRGTTTNAARCFSSLSSSPSFLCLRSIRAQFAGSQFALFAVTVRPASFAGIRFTFFRFAALTNLKPSPAGEGGEHSEPDEVLLEALCKHSVSECHKKAAYLLCPTQKNEPPYGSSCIYLCS